MTAAKEVRRRLDNHEARPSSRQGDGTEPQDLVDDFDVDPYPGVHLSNEASWSRPMACEANARERVETESESLLRSSRNRAWIRSNGTFGSGH